MILDTERCDHENQSNHFVSDYFGRFIGTPEKIQQWGSRVYSMFNAQHRDSWISS